MNLDAQTFQSIVKALRADKSKGSERRTNPRAGLSAHVTITPLKEGDIAPPPVPVHLRDISSTGLGMLCPIKFRGGQKFVIELPRQGDESLAFLCTVMHGRDVGRFSVVGAKLTKELNSDELQRLLMGMPLEEPAAASAGK